MLNFLSFRGRLGRKDFAMTAAAMVAGLIAFVFTLRPAMILIRSARTRDEAVLYGNTLAIIVVILAILLAWTVISAAVRRLRDIGCPWWIGLAVWLTLSVVDVLWFQSLGPRVVSEHGVGDPGTSLISMLWPAGIFGLLAACPGGRIRFPHKRPPPDVVSAS